jgi:hypothetical protein
VNDPENTKPGVATMSLLVTVVVKLNSVVVVDPLTNTVAMMLVSFAEVPLLPVVPLVTIKSDVKETLVLEDVISNLIDLKAPSEPDTPCRNI